MSRAREDTSLPYSQLAEHMFPGDALGERDPIVLQSTLRPLMSARRLLAEEGPSVRSEGAKQLLHMCGPCLTLPLAAKRGGYGGKNWLRATIGHFVRRRPWPWSAASPPQPVFCTRCTDSRPTLLAFIEILCGVCVRGYDPLFRCRPRSDKSAGPRRSEAVLAWCQKG
jgi:hypothetical protein